MTEEVYVDIAALYEALDRVRRPKELSWRQLAGELQISPSTLSRMGDGHRPDITTFAKIVTWLGEPAETFIVGGPRPLRAELSELLRRVQQLEAGMEGT